MNLKKASKVWYIIPVFFIILGVSDLYGTIINPSQYPFQGEMFGKYSIYSSRFTFIFYNIITILILILLIFFDVFRYKKKMLIFLGLSLLTILYPILT